MLLKLKISVNKLWVGLGLSTACDPARRGKTWKLESPFPDEPVSQIDADVLKPVPLDVAADDSPAVSE